MGDLNKNPKIEKGNFRTQIFAAFSASLGGFAMGSVLSYSSPALPSMADSLYFSELTIDQTSWFASLAPFTLIFTFVILYGFMLALAALIACPCMGMCIEQVGRKGSLLILTLPLLLGWVLIGFANNLAMLYVGRFLSGFAGGAYSMVVPIFINETASESIRGRLGLLNAIGIHSGICFPYIVGSFLPYNLLALSLCFIPVLILTLLLFVVESPRFLLAQGNIKKATKALVWLRGTKDVQEELDMIQKNIDIGQEEQIVLRDFFTSPSILKPAGISLGLMFFQVASGIDAVIFFNYMIFKSSGADFSPNVSSVIIGLVQVVAMTGSAFVIDRLGRRPLLLISEIAMAISLAALGGFFYLSQNDPSVKETLGWLPLVSLIIYAIGFAVGMGPIPWIYLEVIPTHVMGLVSGFTVCFNWSIAFLITRFFETLNEEIGRNWTFWIFSIVCFTGAFFAYFCVPETKGKTLEEIQEGFK